MRVALACVGVSAALGLFVGVAWWLLAPRPEYLVGDAGAAALVPATEGAFVAADGLLAVLGLVVGAVLGAVAATRRSDAGPGVVLGVGVGGLLGSAVAAALGMLLGRADVAAAAATAAVGTVVPRAAAGHRAGRRADLAHRRGDRGARRRRQPHRPWGHGVP